ncbi:GNAT family N-acetyltransferase [Marnyiella aurantia]|uniref:GNAT family N-acetyltransferase n=1 Tax=Marnyiella aurantia TaxID=2758037 RepID=A0A7D7QZ74_9FLAO|nr:GNAT family protein [Marnyiella aurantia]MBA5247450.1 GNAT family N-acetyltransferase [Marnyiella aurantia]QMS99206.1 GNAT family N-acetyltransferase [Marnyiella aurantia]
MLKGEKVILRPLKIEDLDKTHEWRNNLELVKLTQGIRFPKTKEMDREWFDYVLNDKSNRNIYLGIDEIESGEFSGIISLNTIDWISGTCTYGLIVGDNEKQGKGYTKEAAKLLFRYAFNVLNLRKIQAQIIAINRPAIILHKLMGGFKQEALFKEHIYADGKYEDMVIMALLKNDFK